MRRWMAGALLLVVAACGDNKTNDKRGYTKAPLENPTVLVQAEKPSEMNKLGKPNLPEAPYYPPEAPAETTKAGPPAGAAPAGAPPAGATAADVAAGKTIFGSTGNCYTCHGPEAAGTPMAPSLTSTKWLNIDGSFASIEGVVNNGVPKPKTHPAPMPAKGGAALTDEQVKQVAAYVYSISRGK